MPHNKKHHYVPKFYLRNFAAGENGIGIYNIPSRRVIPCGNLTNQCYQNYFYGKQPTVEHALAELEGSAATVIRQTLEREAVPTRFSREHTVLSHFIVLQAARTMYEAEASAEATDKFFKTVYRGQLGEVDGYRIGFDDPVLLSLSAASKIVPSVYDLKVKLFRNETDHPFITCDNPIVRHNQYYEGNTSFGQTGWAQAGLQVFVPLSPRLLCVFYDGETYKVEAKDSSVIALTSVQDIEALNALQWLNALENVYFAPGADRIAAAQAPHIIPRRPTDKTSVSEHRILRSHREGDPPDTERTLLHEFRPALPVRLKVGCTKLRRRPRHPRYDNRAAPVRDEKYTRALEGFGGARSQRGVDPEAFLRSAKKYPFAREKSAG